MEALMKQPESAPAAVSDTSTRTSQRPCSDGVYCQAGLAIDCTLGSYCVGGIKTLCPAGTLGNAVGLDSPECNGLCPRGFWCGVGATQSQPCMEGTYGDKQKLKSQDECTDVLEGEWAPVDKSAKRV